MGDQKFLTINSRGALPCHGSPQGVVPLRGGRRLFGAEPSVKNPLLHVSLYGKTPCYRAQRGIEVSCERVRVNRVVGWGDVVKPPTCVKRRCAKRADAEGGENGGMAIIACTCLPTTFLCGWHIYMYYVLCRPYLGLQPLQSALLFWRVSRTLSCGPTTIPLLRLCVCVLVIGSLGLLFALTCGLRAGRVQ